MDSKTLRANIKDAEERLADSEKKISDLADWLFEHTDEDSDVFVDKYNDYNNELHRYERINAEIKHLTRNIIN